jgi:uncharacterized protein YlzI (FlbEa/FlbD family)
VIPVKKLDGSEMYINLDLIERVEDAGQEHSVVYLTDGGHLVVAEQSSIVVARIRTEKASLLRTATLGPEASSGPSGQLAELSRSGRLSGR